jgi:hypothetical protein
MGTYIDVIIDHKVQDYRDRSGVVALLQPSGTWTALPEHKVADFVDYSGSEGLFLRFGRQVAVLTGGRWREFLADKPSRAAALPAFRAVARVIGGTRLVLLPDSSEVSYDAVRDGLSQDRCITMLREQHGPPQESPEEIDPQVAASAAHGVPQVWFLESL